MVPAPSLLVRQNRAAGHHLEGPLFAFLFPADDLIAIALLQVLQTDRDQKRELQILSEFLFKNGASGVVKRKIFEATHPRP